VLVTPHGRIELGAGSYQIAVTAEQTAITVRRPARRCSSRRTILRWLSLRVCVPGSPATAIADKPVVATENLLRNGNFTQDMRDSWESYVIAQNVTPGKVSIMERDGQRVAYLCARGDNVPTEVGIRQFIDKEVNVYDRLVLQLDVKLLFQSLSGAGYLSSEYPLRVEVNYTDIYGKQLAWGHGSLLPGA
jgi:hypothetical protein